MIYSKLRNVMLLLPLLGVSGIAGYGSASLIGLGWTIGLCFLLFVGVISIVLFVQKKEDLRMEQQFEQVLKPLAFHETIADEQIPALVEEGIKELASSEVLEECQAVIEEREPSMEEVSPETPQVETAPDILPEVEAKESEENTTIAENLPIDETMEHERTDQPAQQFEQVLKPLAFHETIADEQIPALVEEGTPELAASEVLEECQAVIEDRKPSMEEVSAETPQVELTAPDILPEVEAEKSEENTTIAENPPIDETMEQEHTDQPAKQSVPFLQEHLDLVLSLSQSAEQSLLQSDYLRAYQALKEAMSYSPPYRAKYVLCRQLVQVLNEMGLYQESISVLETMVSELPAGSSKKRDDLHWQISYLEMLTQFLQAEQKRNLSWSLIPSEIHQRVIEQNHTLLTDCNQKPLTIPFQ